MKPRNDKYPSGSKRTNAGFWTGEIYHYPFVGAAIGSGALAFLGFVVFKVEGVASYCGDFLIFCLVVGIIMCWYWGIKLYRLDQNIKQINHTMEKPSAKPFDEKA